MSFRQLLLAEAFSLALAYISCYIALGGYIK